MLAINTVLSDIGTTETQIFDEIDTGINGRGRQQGWPKLRGVSKKRAGDLRNTFGADRRHGGQSPVHRKAERKGKTFTDVRVLDHGARVRRLRASLAATILRR